MSLQFSFSNSKLHNIWFGISCLLYMICNTENQTASPSTLQHPGTRTYMHVGTFGRQKVAITYGCYFIFIFMVICLIIISECYSLSKEMLLFQWIDFKVSRQVIGLTSGDMTPTKASNHFIKKLAKYQHAEVLNFSFRPYKIRQYFS